ncbi:MULTISPECIES: CheR family methyltransferase [unclassified Herbaspirillum]|uniref:CheR family methyltransferase n=1 Tax=unclassified Herbaspirillum TaxID=2624150 RepID=UPI00383B2671
MSANASLISHDDHAAVEPIAAMLKQNMGLDIAAVGSALIERGVRERMKVLGQADMTGYLHVLQSGVGELQELIELVVVPETWFFRDREAILAVARLAREKIIRAPNASNATVRILSLPCSTGEEPYSIAMALLEAGVPPAQFRIDGVDICHRSLAAAQRAVYGRNSFRGKQLEYRERHFTDGHEGAGQHDWALDEDVRQQVAFRFGNMLSPDFMRNEAPYDFIFCRNVLIYFDRDVQQQAVQVLERLLDRDGCIFVGPAEAGLLLKPHIESIGIPLSFGFRRKKSVDRVDLPLPPLKMVAAIPRIVAPEPAPPPRVRPVQVAPFRQRVPDGTPSAVVQNDLLAQARARADRGELAQAEALCEQLNAVSPNADAYHLQGLISDARQDASAAQQLYRKAIYLQPDHREALLHLAALLAAQGDDAGAQRLQERAERARKAQLKPVNGERSDA